MGINGGRSLAPVAVLGLLTFLAAGWKTPVQAQDSASSTEQGEAIVQRAVAFRAAHPRVRSRFEDVYRDRARTYEARMHGQFAMELPRAHVHLDGDTTREITLDATGVRVLVPLGEGEPPMLLAFALDQTPLPTILGVLDGTTPARDAFAIRRIVADGDDVVELRPREPLAVIDRLWLEIAADGAVTRALLVDAVGGSHRIVFMELDYPRRLSEAALTGRAPADAERVEP